MRFRIEQSNNLNGRGRCIVCDARNYCGLGYFKCYCKMHQYYINIKKERKNKLNKIFKTLKNETI